MSKHLETGVKIPGFQYDTPHQPQKSFQTLLQEAETPVLMVMLRNFGHPITRHYIENYLQTADFLGAARLVCVVQSQPKNLQAAVPQSGMPFEVICDAAGALYDYFEVPEAGRLTSYSIDAMKIISAAKKEGYTPQKGERQRLPLTALIQPDGTVVFAYYGKTLTDMPEDCAAMEQTVQIALEQWATLQPSAEPSFATVGAAPEAQPEPDAFAQTLPDEIAVEPLAQPEPVAEPQPESDQEDFYQAFEALKQQLNQETELKQEQSNADLDVLGFGDFE